MLFAVVRSLAIAAVAAGLLAGCGAGDHTLPGTPQPGGATREPVTRVAEVLKVIDGDTIRVRLAGGRSTERVRLIGIDAPELSTTRTGYAECGGREAAAALARLLPRGSAVQLTADATQDRRDRFGRLLAYVGVTGGTAQEQLLREGWARVYVYDQGLPFARVDPFRRAAKAAREARRGVWGACAGDFARPER